MSGRGIGVAGALFAAIDAGPKTWEEGGLWRRRPAVRLYRWRRSLQAAVVLLVAAAAILLVPLLVLATGLVAYPWSLLVQMVDVDAGHRLATGYSGLIARAFSPGMLPTYIPRLVTFVLGLAVLVLVAAALRPIPREKRRGHRERGPWWTRLVGSPWCAAPGLQHFRQALWQLFRGPVNAKEPSSSELGKRYVELLAENLGQPGFRELIVTTLDLESRTDLIFAMIAEQRRERFFHRGHSDAKASRHQEGASRHKVETPPYERPGDLVDLAGTGRGQVLDALAGALSLPVLTEPHLIAFSPESYWKGETHRSCDRPAAIDRLLHELVVSGVEQVIVVSACSDRSAPHRLSRPYGTLESRLSEHLSAAEASAVRDGVAAQASRFQGVFLIQPAHNPVGPFDFKGAYDERSDRFQSLEELVDRGYEDAYRQFIEPVVGGTD